MIIIIIGVLENKEYRWMGEANGRVQRTTYNI